MEAAPRIKIFSASLLQRASPLYSTFQPYICCTTEPIDYYGQPLPFFDAQGNQAKYDYEYKDEDEDRKAILVEA
jgi:hypothetical protein